MYLLTVAQVFFRRYTALDCRADRIARRDEKFLSWWHSWATEIHFSMMRARWAELVWWELGCNLGDLDDIGELEAELGAEFGVEFGAVGAQSSEVMTQLVTELNWAIVALTLGAKLRFSFLSLWDQTQPRQWNGTTRTNRACAQHTGQNHSEI